jgi:hypothetical protein
MTPEEKQSKEYEQRLEKLSDWMIKSGLAVRHGHTQQRVGIELTPNGINLVKMFYHIDKSLGEIADRDRIALWHYLCALGEARNKP